MRGPTKLEVRMLATLALPACWLPEARFPHQTTPAMTGQPG